MAKLSGSFRGTDFTWGFHGTFSGHEYGLHLAHLRLRPKIDRSGHGIEKIQERSSKSYLVKKIPNRISAGGGKLSHVSVLTQ